LAPTPPAVTSIGDPLALMIGEETVSAFRVPVARKPGMRNFDPSIQHFNSCSMQGPALEQHVNMLPNSCRKIDQLPIKIVAGKSINISTHPYSKVNRLSGS
jgi:hypothetical protein